MVSKDHILFLDAADVRTPQQVRYIHVEQFIHLLVEWSTSTVRDRISMVRSYFRFLFFNGYIQEHIAEKIPFSLTPCGRTKLPVVWSENEIRWLLEGMDVANPNEKRNYAMNSVIFRSYKLSPFVKYSYCQFKHCLKPSKFILNYSRHSHESG